MASSPQAVLGERLTLRDPFPQALHPEAPHPRPKPWRAVSCHWWPLLSWACHLTTTHTQPQCLTRREPWFPA